MPPDSDAPGIVPTRWLPDPPGNVHRENRKLLSSVVEALSLPKRTQLCGSMNSSSFPTQTVGADRIRPKPTKLSGWMNGKSVWLLPLGFPRGEAGFFGNRHFGTDCQKRLMRGSERLVNECSWMSGVCSRLHHSTGKSKTLRCRRPSSVSLRLTAF